VDLHLEATLAGDSLTASGEARIRQTDFGIEPVSAVGGAVKVKDEVLVRYAIRARRRHADP
jgi:hypothetical protein